MKVSECFTGNYIDALCVTGKDATLTIKSVTAPNTEKSANGQLIDKPIVRFEETDKGFILTGTTQTSANTPSDVYLAKLSAERVPATFVRGDGNGDGEMNIADATCILGYLFAPGDGLCPATIAACPDAADANDNGVVDLSDAIMILLHLFGDVDTLPPPSTVCGDDATEDGLHCLSFGACP